MLRVLIHYFKINFSQAIKLINSKMPANINISPHVLALQRLLNIESLRIETVLYIPWQNHILFRSTIIIELVSISLGILSPIPLVTFVRFWNQSS